MKRIYLDYAAATPVSKQVKSVMKMASAEAWANASSLHEEGEKAREILERARKDIALELHCRADALARQPEQTAHHGVPLRHLLLVVVVDHAGVIDARD